MTPLAAHTPPPGGASRDADLLARCRQGQQDAFGELFTSYHAYAVKIALNNTCPSDVQDVAAEAFTRIFQAIRGGKGPVTDFKSYLASAVRNICRSNHQRKGHLAVEPDVLVSLAPPSSDAAAEAVVADSDRELLTQVFGALPERWRTALWTVEVEERPIAELAALLAISPNAASALCVRARAGLRQAWAKATVPEPEMQATH